MPKYPLFDGRQPLTKEAMNALVTAANASSRFSVANHTGGQELNMGSAGKVVVPPPAAVSGGTITRGTIIANGASLTLASGPGGFVSDAVGLAWTSLPDGSWFHWSSSSSFLDPDNKHGAYLVIPSTGVYLVGGTYTIQVIPNIPFGYSALPFVFLAVRLAYTTHYDVNNPPAPIDGMFNNNYTPVSDSRLFTVPAATSTTYDLTLTGVMPVVGPGRLAIQAAAQCVISFSTGVPPAGTYGVTVVLRPGNSQSGVGSTLWAAKIG